LAALLDMQLDKTWNVNICQNIQILFFVELEGVFMVERQEKNLLMIDAH
jgi:hypothetical protein